MTPKLLRGLGVGLERRPGDRRDVGVGLGLRTRYCPYRRARTSLVAWTGVAAGVLASCGLFDPGDPPLEGCLPGYEQVAQTAAAELNRYGIDDAALLLRVRGRAVCRLFLGSYGPATAVPTASAAKWLTAAAMLALVDAGTLRLDTRVAELFAAAPPHTADITLAQLLSHTSGLLWFSRCMGRPDDTLQACAESILEGDLHFSPGTGFFYAGPPFTVAGALAERATGQSWAEVFRSTIADPLGMSGTSYGGGPNPALSEGDVVSTLDEYGRFAQMLLDRGRWGGRQVLSEDAVGRMRLPWSAGTEVVSSPRGELPYGLGVWLDAQDGEGVGTVLSSPGSGGFVPLIDYPRRLVFVFETFNDLSRIWPGVVAMLGSARASADGQP